MFFLNARSVLCLQNMCRSLKQLDGKHKQITTWSLYFWRVWSSLHVFALISRPLLVSCEIFLR